MVNKEKFLSRISEEEILSATPSMQLSAYHYGDKAIELQLGEKYKFYDIASLTKIVFTCCHVMELVEDSSLDLYQDVNHYWPEFPKGLRVYDLLVHGAGHRWWAPFYQDLGMLEEIRDANYFVQQWSKLESLLVEEKRQASEKNIYSDVDFLILGSIFQKIHNANLFDIYQEFSHRWGLKNCFFHKNNILSKDAKEFAPTEYSEYLKKPLQGQVHDENTYSLGGVSTHAGLFSHIKALENWMMHIRNIYYFDSGPVSRITLLDFSKRQVSEQRGDWGIGFMMPTKNKASCGKYFSHSSFGHTGFTGTSIWMDPVNDIFVTVLSNRVCPTRENKKFVKMRSEIHDAIYNILKE